MIKKQTKKPKMVKISHEKMHQLCDAIQDSNLDDDISRLVIDLVSGSHWLIEAIERGEMTIAKLRQLLFGAHTETYQNRKRLANASKEAALTTEAERTPQEKTKKKGHGRLSVDAYAGAHIVDVLLENLKPGDPCPTIDCEGRLYEMSNPGVLIRITANPMATATRYQLQKLRCYFCDAIFTAPLPKGVGTQKYDPSFVAMLMINKYFMAIPLYRQENLQRYLGVPLPSSTQWELMASFEKVLSKLYEAFIQDAAQAKGLSFDDTKANILEQIAVNKVATRKKEKKGCYTTGVVSAHDDHLSYVFLTNNKTAGKDLGAILTLRDPSLPPPYLMCDALTANIPSSIDKSLYILCYCLVHARRQFYQLPEGYNDLAEQVIHRIGKIYDHEEHAKTLSPDERLSYHREHSQPIMTKLKAYLEEQKKDFEPNSAPGEAIQYVLTRWTELNQFLNHPGAPIDNNLTERALKLVIQVRKSSLFYKTLRSARIASTIQTAIYSAAQNDINPYEYIKAVLTHADKVEKAPEKWLPWNYQDTLLSLKTGKARQGSGAVSEKAP